MKKHYAICILIATSLLFADFDLLAQSSQWTIASADTKVSLALNATGKLDLTGLSNPVENFNWVKKPSALPFVSRLSVNGKVVQANWKFKTVEVDRENTGKLQLVFSNAAPAMELVTVWEAKQGPGPVRNTIFLRNLAGKTITIYKQESVDMSVAGLPAKTSLVYINDDASVPDKKGVYNQRIPAAYSKTLRISEVQDWIPFTALHVDDQHGMYIGWEWSIGRLSISNKTNSAAIQLKAGISNTFKTDIDAGETFEVPPAFIGTYKGDFDACGNSLRKYLFANSMPAMIRKDTGFPKVQWNAFAALGKEKGGWDPVESKYYPFIDDIAPLGFEEVVIDVGWWSSYGDPGHIITDPVDWPGGMPAAAKYAKDRGLRFGLYDNESENLTSDSGKAERIRDISFLIEDLKADFYRSDATAGPVISGTYGKNQRARYKEDVSYWSIRGFYEVIDSMYRKLPGFLWENCSSGGGLKDFGAVGRAARVQNQDVYWPVQARRSFYDASHVLPPMQLASVVGSWGGWYAEGSVYEFRSASMGAAYWHPDAPNGGNGGKPWTDQQKEAIKRAVTTYKEKLRPLIREADLYHIFPRPDSVHWDGVQYFNPKSGEGVVYIFKPNNETNHQLIKLKGLDANANYQLTFEDGSNKTTVQKGAVLMEKGIDITLKGDLASELMFIERQEE